MLDDLNDALHDRVRIANDADCFALSEALDGAGAGAPIVFGVILGTGVGGGIVVDGKLLGGPNAITGEWGHTPLPYFRADTAIERSLPDRPCYCGRTNCVETFLSGPGTREDASRADRRTPGSRRCPNERRRARPLHDDARPRPWRRSPTS